MLALLIAATALILLALVALVRFLRDDAQAEREIEEAWQDYQRSWRELDRMISMQIADIEERQRARRNLQ